MSTLYSIVELQYGTRNSATLSNVAFPVVLPLLRWYKIYWINETELLGQVSALPRMQASGFLEKTLIFY